MKMAAMAMEMMKSLRLLVPELGLIGRCGWVERRRTRGLQ